MLTRLPGEARQQLGADAVPFRDHCRAAKRRHLAAGAVIVMAPEDKDYGGRGYGCRDPEGNLWSFGSYDPWQDEAG